MRERASSRRFHCRAMLLVLTLALAAIVCTTASPHVAATEAVDPRVVKAHFLRNFAKLVTWPEERFDDKDSPIVIGVLGTDPFDGRLVEAVRGRTAQGRSLEVRRLPVVDGRLPTAEQLTDCHLLFVGGSERERVPQILGRLGNASVMTVSDLEHFTAAGGVAELLEDGPNIKFRLNREVAEALGLEVSVRMLSLAVP